MRSETSFDQCLAYSDEQRIRNRQPAPFIMERVPTRVLVVEDFAPFREFICSTLGQKPHLRVIGSVSDGREAVQKAEELRPDLILLDIGLPTIDGIEVARQVRKLTPESKIIFLTQEYSRELVEAALGLGAWGYAGSDLLAAVEAGLMGKRFVSGGLSGQTFTHTSQRPSADD